MGIELRCEDMHLSIGLVTSPINEASITPVSNYLAILSQFSDLCIITGNSSKVLFNGSELDLEQIAEAGRRFVEEHFSFEKVVENWKGILQDTLIHIDSNGEERV